MDSNSKVKFYIGIGLCLFLLRGAYDMAFKSKQNRCEMTYMFEYPQYIKIKLPTNNQTKHQYGLYIYGEGTYASQLSMGNYNGIPVLFIPGNQGSFKQVRSLGSVAYQKNLDEKFPFHFDFFSIDFNEEIGAFYGPLLERQTQFVALAIRKILELYKKAVVKPSTVILVGHSLGGLIARAVVTLPEISASTVPLIVSQATPHSFPIIIPDSHIAGFYEKVHYHWQEERNRDFINTVLVTIGAGKNDFQVPNFFTTSEFADVDASTLGVPSCWLTTDHLAVVWCKQLVLATVRALYDAVDVNQKRISTDKNKVIDAFTYQLVQRGGPKHGFPLVFESLLSPLDRNGHWSEIAKRQHQHESLRPIRTTYLMIPLRKTPDDYQHVSIVAKELDWADWVFACKDDVLYNKTKMCSSGENLSQYGRIIPGNKKEANIKTAHLMEKGFTHIVVLIKPTDDKVQVWIDMSNRITRQSTVSAPKFISSMSPVEVKSLTPLKALTFNVTIKDLTEPWQSYVLSVTPTDVTCGSPRPRVSLISSWHKRWEYISSQSKDVFDYPIEIDVPIKDPNEKNPYVKAHLVLNPNCQYEINLSKNYRGIFQRLAQLYATQLPAFFMCHFILILATQLKGLATGEKSSSVFSSLLLLSPITVVPFAKISSLVLSSTSFVETDFAVLTRQGRDLGLLPIVLFLSSLPVSLLAAFLTWVLIIGFGNATHKFAVKILKRAIRSGDILTEIAVAGFWKVPAVAAVGLIAMSFASCGAFAMLLAAGLYFIKVFLLYEDYLETFLISLIPGTRQAHVDQRAWQLSSIHLHFTAMFISILLALLNLPTLIVWVKSSQAGTELPSDPSLVPAVISLVAQGILWQLKTIDHNKLFYKELGFVVHAGAVGIVLFGTIHLYRINFVASSILLFVALHQLLAPRKPEEEATAIEEEKVKLAHMEVVEEEEKQIQDVQSEDDKDDVLLLEEETTNRNSSSQSSGQSTPS